MLAAGSVLRHQIDFIKHNSKYVCFQLITVKGSEQFISKQLCKHFYNLKSLLVDVKYYESFLPEGGWKEGNPGYPGIPGKLPKGLVGLGAAPPPLLSMA